MKVLSISELSDPGIHVHYSTYCHVYFIRDEGTWVLRWDIKIRVWSGSSRRSKLECVIKERKRDLRDKLTRIVYFSYSSVRKKRPQRKKQTWRTSTSVRIKEKNNFLHVSVHERKIKEIKKRPPIWDSCFRKFHKAALEPTNIIEQN